MTRDLIPDQGIRGIAASEGITIGRAALLETTDLPIRRLSLAPDQVEEEVSRFHHAVEESVARLDRLNERVHDLGPAGNASIVDAYVALLRDPWLTSNTEALIASDHINAEWALEKTLESVRQTFEQIDDADIRERLQDIEFVAERVLRHLLGMDVDSYGEVPPGSVVFAHQLSPIDGLHLFRAGVLGLVTEIGSLTSHLAIMARTHGVPCVVGAHDVCQLLRGGEIVVVDGGEGEVHISPGPEVLRAYSDRQRALFRLNRQFFKRRLEPSCTRDGCELHIQGNIDLPEEAAELERMGGHGVGLFRTEYLFLNRDEFCEEDFQFEQYRQVAASFPEAGVTIRTLDLGGDKFLSLRGDKSGGPNLEGLRAIRLSLAEPDLFRVQLRALLRVAAIHPVRVLFPFVTSWEELRQIREQLAEARRELDARGAVYHKGVEIGLMVEIPSVAILADLFVQHVDFLSIGTNDLIQYTLAVERDNEMASYLYQPLHPAILHLLRRVARAGQRHDKPVSVCGEMAGNPLFVPLFTGLGITLLSSAPRVVPLIKEIVRGLDRVECEALVTRLLDLPCHTEIEHELQLFMAARFPRLAPLLHLEQMCPIPDGPQDDSLLD
jgi:phosphoenolpyruvate-protein phosphotransferase (PTS system enzyme I)